MSETIIRNAQQTDHNIITNNNIALAWETEQSKLDQNIVAAGVKTAFSDSSKGFYLIAEINGNVAGQLMVTREWFDWCNKTIWWIQSVYVLPEFRSNGVYSSLYGQVLQLARNDGTINGIRLYVDADNENAKRIYQKSGMRKSHYLLYEFDL
ncbi:MAG: GNAT family N-acetyltransferase [Candidatus Marinimicrobia bacterium]|nr:GNAT family N-acetyltransferase [Candidatus Neomarinimicrobiota bacterium]